MSMFSNLTRSAHYTVLLALLMSIHAAMLAWGAYRHSPVEDEIGHLAAGIQHWQTGWFDLYRVNPPLVRMVAAIPVLVAGSQPPEKQRFDLILVHREEFRVGAEFVRKNGERSFWLFTLGRWACIPFSLVGAYVCFRWARELYNAPAGILALVMWCFSPNIIAHGQLITPDTGAAALGASAGYFFWRWLRGPTWPRTFAAGAMLGLAELTKMTLIVLFAIWPILWLAWRWSERRNVSWRQWRRQAGQLTVLLVLAVQVINFGYGFEGSFRRLGRHTFLSSLLSDKKPAASTNERRTGGRDSLGNRFARTWLASVPVPFPQNYLQGVDRQRWGFERRQWSYLRDEWRTKGWWYYYLYGLAAKVPLGTWVLFLLAVVLSWWKLPGGSQERTDLVKRTEDPTVVPPCKGGTVSAAWRDELVLFAPAMVMLVLVSSQTGINKHLRYLLPAFPFVFIWISKVGRAFERKHWRIATIAAVALVWSVGSSSWIYPHSLSYFNELAGGPKNGHAHLLGSNIDWGQDLLYLKRWLDQHPEAQPLGLAYVLDSGLPYTLVDPRTAAIDHTVPPTGPDCQGNHLSKVPDQLGPLPGWYAISVSYLRDRGRQYAYFLDFEPVAMAGYSIYIYHITPEEANRVRCQLGMEELRARGERDEQRN